MRETESIEDFAESVKTKADFEKFLRLLIDDFRRKGETWGNQDLQAFLEGLFGFTVDMTGYYQNTHPKINLERPSWRVMADLLLAARVYE